MPAVSPRKLSSPAFTSSACVQVTACGPSFTINWRAPLMSLAVRRPVAVMGRNHERGHVDASQVFTEIFMPRCDARETGRRGGAGRDVPTGLDDLFAYTLFQQCVGVVEVLKETSEEGIPVGSDRLLNPREHAAIHPLGVVRGLQQVRGDAGNNYGFAHTV